MIAYDKHRYTNHFLCINAKKIIRALMFIISNRYGIKRISNLLQSEECNIMFEVISDIMAHWYDMRNTNLIAISFSSGMKMISAFVPIISNHYG